MAKARGIKPETWTDSKIMRLSIPARMMFVASWNFACDNGHIEDDPFQLKMRTMPADSVDADALVEEIVSQGLYERTAGYLVIRNFTKHQRIDKRFVVTCALDGCTRGARGEHDESPTSARGGHDERTRGSRDEGEGEGEGEGEVTTGARKRTPATKPAKSKGSRLPDIFPISEEMREWGRTNCPGLDASREHEKFCDYWRGVSGQRGVKVDWVATWRNWMRRAHEDHAPAAAATGPSLPDWMLA